jgi:hypothetical protein
LTGIIIDRSDWNNFYNHAGDDGMSWVNGRPAHSMKQSYLNITRELRGLYAQRQKDAHILMNGVGYTCLSFMEPMDGTFSEGRSVSAVGLLGIQSTAILWTLVLDRSNETTA